VVRDGQSVAAEAGLSIAETRTERRTGRVPLHRAGTHRPDHPSAGVVL